MAVLLLSSAALSAGAQAGTPTCSIRSPMHRVALVELYTSEGCSSCPPADDWLSMLGAKVPRDAVVPLALHVDYWNNLGWNDRFAQHDFTLRQQALTDQGGGHVVYTPEVFVAGQEARHWSSPQSFEAAVKQVDMQPAGADIDLAVTGGTPRAIDLAANFKLPPGSARHADAFVAVYENRLVTQVGGGENGGATLHHEYVVRKWLGPIALTNGAGAIRQRVELGSFGANVPVSRFGVAAFVQDAASGAVLQATALPACS
jgi:hypothetical protein